MPMLSGSMRASRISLVLIVAVNPSDAGTGDMDRGHVSPEMLTLTSIVSEVEADMTISGASAQKISPDMVFLNVIAQIYGVLIPWKGQPSQSDKFAAHRHPLRSASRQAGGQP